MKNTNSIIEQKLRSLVRKEIKVILEKKYKGERLWAYTTKDGKEVEIYQVTSKDTAGDYIDIVQMYLDGKISNWKTIKPKTPNKERKEIQEFLDELSEQ